MDDSCHPSDTSPPIPNPSPAAAHATDRAGLGVALQSRDMRLLWAGLVTSSTGDSFLLVAMLTFIATLTTSPLALAAFAASVGVPTVLFGLFAGVIVDRFDRRRTMLASDLTRAGAVLALLLVDDISDLPIMLAVGFIMGTAGVLFIPARNALLPRIVQPRGLVAANMLVESSHVIALVVGPTLGGLFVARWGHRPAIIADSLGYLVSAVAIYLLSVRRAEPHAASFTATQLFNELAAGLRFILHHPVLSRLISAGGASMLGLGAVIILGVRHVETTFGVDAAGFGALLSILGLGMVVGGLLAATPAAYEHPVLFVGTGMSLLGATLALFPFLTDLTHARVTVFVIGLSLIAARSVVAALIQLNTPDDRRGRVESANNVIVAAAYNASFVLAGLVGAAAGTHAVFVAAGVLTVVAGIVALGAIRRHTEQPTT